MTPYNRSLKTYMKSLQCPERPGVTADSHSQMIKTWTMTFEVTHWFFFMLLKVKHGLSPWPSACTDTHLDSLTVSKTYTHTKCVHACVSVYFHRLVLLYCLWWWRATRLLTQHRHPAIGRIIHHALPLANRTPDWYIRWPLKQLHAILMNYNSNWDIQEREYHI